MPLLEQHARRARNPAIQRTRLWNHIFEQLAKDPTAYAITDDQRLYAVRPEYSIHPRGHHGAPFAVYFRGTQRRVRTTNLWLVAEDVALEPNATIVPITHPNHVGAHAHAIDAVRGLFYFRSWCTQDRALRYADLVRTVPLQTLAPGYRVGSTGAFHYEPTPAERDELPHFTPTGQALDPTLALEGYRLVHATPFDFSEPLAFTTVIVEKYEHWCAPQPTAHYSPNPVAALILCEDRFEIDYDGVTLWGEAASSLVALAGSRMIRPAFVRLDGPATVLTFHALPQTGAALA